MVHVQAKNTRHYFITLFESKKLCITPYTTLSGKKLKLPVELGLFRTCPNFFRIFISGKPRLLSSLQIWVSLWYHWKLGVWLFLFVHCNCRGTKSISQTRNICSPISHLLYHDHQLEIWSFLRVEGHALLRLSWQSCLLSTLSTSDWKNLSFCRSAYIT